MKLVKGLNVGAVVIMIAAVVELTIVTSVLLLKLDLRGDRKLTIITLVLWYER